MIMALEWKLRKVMADKEIWSGSELARLMKEKSGYSLSAPSISALLNGNPKQVKANTMDALCTALDCSPADLWKHTPTYTQNIDSNMQPKLAKASNDNRLPPI